MTIDFGQNDIKRSFINNTQKRHIRVYFIEITTLICPFYRLTDLNNLKPA